MIQIQSGILCISHFYVTVFLQKNLSYQVCRPCLAFIVSCRPPSFQEIVDIEIIIKTTRCMNLVQMHM